MRGSVAAVVCSLAGMASALTMPVVQTRASSSSGISFTYGSDSSSSSSSSSGSGQPNIVNIGNSVYRTNITLGGRDISVQIDTGSTDLWVYPSEKMEDVTLSKATPRNLTYGSGSAYGPIAFAPFEIGKFSVESQAFLNATETTDFESILFSRGIYGIMGLGFDTDDSSQVLGAVYEASGNSTKGLSPLANIFQQNKSLPNYISVMLGRSGDLEDTANGMFTISEYIEGYEAIEQEPKLSRVNSTGETRWSVLLDAITVNGKAVTLNSSTSGIPKNKSIAVLDTGATQAQLPSFIVDALYSAYPDSVYDYENGIWIVPCNATADVRFTFGGKEIPIHPLELTSVGFYTTNSDGANHTYCYSNYGPFNLPSGAFVGFDMLLGDGFLRNVYALFDYGDFVDPTKNETSDAFVQLLALENPSDAASDFQKSRQQALSQLPPEATIAQYVQSHGLNTSSSSSSSSSATSSGSSTTDSTLAADISTDGSDSDSGYTALLSRVDSYGPAILGVLAGNLLVGIVLCVLGFMMCIRRGASAGKIRNAPVYAPVRFKESPRAEDEPFTPKYSD